MEEIAPGIFVETGYPPYNLALIRTNDGALAVDLPPHPEHARQWLDTAQEAVGKIKYVILSDAAPERQVAASLSGHPLIATTATRSLIMSHDERGWHELLEAVSGQYDEAPRKAPPLKQCRIALSFSVYFNIHADIGLLHFEAAPGGPPGALWITLPNQHLLFAGDIVAIDEPPPLENSANSQAWFEALGLLSGRSEIQRIVAGRGTTPVLRGAVEQEREFVRTMRRTAHDLFKHRSGGLNYTQAGQDLGQTFFNKAGNKATRRIRKGLEHLVAEIQAAQPLKESPEAVESEE
ncbi:MAG: hypothetical protein JXA21_25860 [Anaerolineae bacterium]|nr:hypothetical protein [Anaerolineae bacterium]